ncbi:cytochrome c1 [Legionella resiliens]|uniref:Cytochrome c1 n=1 Tax=Legionella resiliens TaxID=2905958 RepID=A0ABS8X236_9GAMM|nr:MULTISPECIES: cytochrome c1 [unclassified Legionella]MCE0722356.1 cytochrome c1 [Legionella sp. 9fVS26]MCE3531510.1 cytochrome c1 [Legionella sp. 8cVS16]
MRMKGVSFYLSLCFFSLLLNSVVLAHSAEVDVQDKASLQRGARLFMNYCSGCHSLNYLRYNHMAKGLGITRFDGRINEDLLKNNLIFTQATVNDPIRIALPPEDAKQWFGIVPPDLSLVAREKGTEWLYSYLNGFYRDDARPFGTNNRLVPGVAMPNILETLNHELPKDQFNNELHDLVSFLAYVGEPMQSIRYRIGLYVVSFLFVLFLVVLGLKRVYWRKNGIK